MDKRFLQSIGVTVGLPRWKAYLLFIGGSAIGAALFFSFIWVFYMVFAPIAEIIKN